MHRRGIFFSTLTALALAAVPALAEGFSYPAAKVHFITPSGWNVKTTPSALVTFDRANDTAVAFTAVDDGSVAQASALVGRRLASQIDNMKITKEERLTINGMPAVLIEGDGFQNRVNIDWAMAVVGTPSNENDLMVLVIAEDAKLARHKGEIRGIFSSITPL
jgi:hypothetical protein